MEIVHKFSDALFTGGEQTILSQCAKMISIALETNGALLSFLNGEEGIGRIRELEKRSDKEKFRISNAITTGAIAPNIIDKILALLDQQDNIINSMYNLAREIRRYKVKSARLEKTIINKLIDINGLAESALKALRDMYREDDLYKIRDLREIVEDFEEAGDEIKEALLDYAYSGKVNFKDFYHLMETAHRADDILDYCEDSSDTLMTIMSSIIS
jgi:uncharacterized protein Yka (UPF0111/DUF47 family)